MADVIPGCGGTSTSGTPSIAASSAACSGPAPPKATSANSRGSRPRSTVIERIVCAMFALATVRMPAAASRRSIPSSSASRSTAASARSVCNGISPPRKRSGSIRPSTRCASVIVGSSPPSPYAAGPGTAPALRGPTLKAPAASTCAIEPPPAPIVSMSNIGTSSG